MEKVYGLKEKTCGVYLLTCQINNKKYIGSSVDIAGRLSTHFGRETKLYPYKPLYKDIIKYGRDNFSWEVLELCNREELIEKERKWYDLIKPEYNLIRPNDMTSYTDKDCEKRMKEMYEKNGEHLKELYSSDYYKSKFRNVQKNRFVSCYMIDKTINQILKEFETYTDAGNWISENTNFTTKNKVSKIRECCLGNRKSAFGYKWKIKE